MSSLSAGEAAGKTAGKAAGRVYAILMASGFSRRFGGADKLLAPFRGKPLARHTLDLVCGLDCFTRIFFVAAEEPVLALARGGSEGRLVLIRNEHPERGQRESIRLGLEAASADGGDGGPGAEYYMFFPCDQPLLNAAAVRRVVEARRPGCIVRPCYRGEPGNPALFSGLFRDELLALAPGERGRDLIRRHPESLVTVEIAAPPFPGPRRSPLTDIDDPRTLSRLERSAQE